MKPRTARFIWKMNRTEIFFFLIIFFVFPILTDFEINFYEKTDSTPADLFVERLAYGTLRMFPYFIYYKIIITYLFEKRYFLFTILVGAFLIFLTVYIKLEHGLISQLTFLPDQTVRSAEKWFHYKPKLFPFSIVFVFREMLMFTALAYFIRSTQQELQMQTMRQKQVETELNYLKIQLQPHFFFNTLNNIYSLAMQRSEKTAPLIAKHAEMMRYILYHSKQQTVRMSHEIAFLRNYVEVETLRYPTGMDIRFEAQVVNDGVTIEPLLLLPFIENAFKHGIREETGKGFVHIIICLTEEELILEVRNSKPVNPYHPKKVGKGIGLENAVNRLNMLYAKHQLAVTDCDDTYEVNLTLPLLNHD
ncbi:sensor histidine kinase [Dyadobacter subterraneus]|uniref:Histidine kinase n=1 Tax=Dyadobacter subterraneus TaxID=2773304 RepID=A0ABR9WDN7_9BACT|nr:histidine kinase [Dyadobacter subterraneus]MBE9463612.1 histidine kinase [Dyadobacter subterraneus]